MGMITKATSNHPEQVISNIIQRWQLLKQGLDWDWDWTGAWTGRFYFWILAIYLIKQYTFKSPIIYNKAHNYNYYKKKNSSMLGVAPFS